MRRRILNIDGHPDPSGDRFIRALAAAQRQIEWASHRVFLYPLWLGAMPSLTKAFFEQCLRPGFAFAEPRGRARSRR